MLVNREVILAKIESTYNTDPVPVAATDAILVESPSWSHEGARSVERPAIRANIGTLRHIYGGSLISVTFSCEIKGSGAAYSASVAPEIDVLLRACGFGVTIDTTASSETATYVPVSTGHESVTIYYYRDGKLKKITGCRGNASFNLETGNKGMVEFTMTGHEQTETDAAIVSPTYDSVVPAAVINAPFTVDSYSAIINALTLDMANEMSTPPDISATDGYGEIRITKRDPNGSFDPEDILLATYDFINEWKTDTAVAMTTGQIGATQYNQYTMTMPAISYREIAPGDRDGIRTLDIGYAAAESSGDDEVSILFD